jgi:phosphoribosylformimino-5-aminoimidazole carboxamide ribotide isomerase
MIAYPAIDLRDGQVVQLVGGRFDAQRVAWPDPVAIAQKWIDAGFQALHVVDLDAALGTGENRTVIAEILNMSSVPVQVGGGVRDDATVDDLLEAGAAQIIVGTRAIQDPSWRATVARRCAGRIVVAADVYGDMIVTKGWTEKTELRADAFLGELAGEPLAAVLVTDVGREGRMEGVDVAKFDRLIHLSSHDIIAAGGIRDMSDLRSLAAIGAAGAVLGMALYTGAVDALTAAAGLV